ncbi:MAG: TRAP transporter substrate-binding protein [Betaproteobacteria bacterium]|nr:TRAP transporter substrate-binding protein [Betaproteobacteria bacterium]
MVRAKKLLGALAALFATAPLTAAADVTLTASAWVPPTHAMTTTQAWWCGEVAKATSNRVKCNILPKPVAAPPATFDAVRDGLADVSFGVHGYTPGRFVLSQMVELPFGGANGEINSVAYQHVYDKYLARLNEHKGVKVLAVFTHGAGDIFNTKRPIQSVADLQGLKFRVGGGIVNEIGKALGTTVILKPAPESYELLSTGVMDGVFFPAESIESFKLEKIVKHATTFPGGLYNTSFAFVMNEDAWRRIPKADQDIIAKLTGEPLARAFGQAWDRTDKSAHALMQTTGVKMMPAPKAFMDEIRAKTAPLEQKWIADAKAKGLANAEQVLKEFRAEVAKP